MRAAPILLIHSGGFTSRQWRKLGDALAPTHTIIAPDLVGYGARPRWPAGTPFQFQTDLELLAELLVEPMHLVGHSYGGFLALQLALAHPERVRSLALYEPVAFGIFDEPPVTGAFPRFELANPDAWLAAFVDWWNGAGAWEKLARDTQDAFRDVAWKVSEEVRTLMADRTGARYAEIAQPTLLLGGGQSPAVERRVLDALAVTLPHATLRVFPELGHMGPITAAPVVNAAIIEHVVASER